MQNEIITNETYLNEERKQKILRLIFDSDINIVYLIERTCDSTLLSKDIHHNTFLKNVKQLRDGIPYFVDGESKHVNLLLGLARRMSTEVELHAYYIDYSLSDKDIAIIRGYTLLISCYIFNSMNKNF